MFRKAYEGGYAIGAFNVNNMEIVQGITEAAQLEQAPVILQVSAGARKYAKHIYLTKLVEAAVADTDVPIALHLDHGDGFEICKDCIDGGFTSVMIDGSKLSFEENIAVTRKVVEYAHDHGVMVEGELGKLAGIEDAVNVSEADAQPGDLVFYPNDTHVGIVGGFDSGGNIMVIHCASSENNVVVTGKSGFTSIGRPEYFAD